MRMLCVCLFSLLVFSAFAHGQGVPLRGEVFGPGDDPVDGADVWLSQERRVRTTVTDTDGRFAFEDVTVGPVEVVVRKPGLSLGGYMGFLAGEGAITVRLTESERAVLRILDLNYRPVSGARVRSLAISGQFHIPVEDLEDHGLPSMRSDDEGRIVLDELPEDAHLRFVVTHYDYADLMVPYLPLLERTQDFTLEPGVELRGQVTTVGEPVDGARVVVYMGTTHGPVARAEALTDADGLYRLRAPEGDYAVAVRHPDYAPPPPEPVTLQDDGGEHLADLALRTPRRIEGTVVFDGGRPSAGVRVGYRVEDLVYEETFTQNDGSFSLKVGTQQGLVQVTPPPGYMTRALSTIPFDMGDEERADLSPVVLIPLPEIQGVVRGVDGEPAAHTLVASLDLKPPHWALTDEDGRFMVRLPVMPDQDTVTFRAEHRLRFERAEFEVDVRSREPHEIALEPFDPDLEPRPVGAGMNNLTPLVGEPAPPLKCDEWVNGDPVELEDLNGKVVVLTFWAGFDDSPYGLNRMVEMAVLHKLYEGVDDVVFLGVHDATVDPVEVAQYVEMLEVPFPVGCDADPFVSFDRYGVNFIPQTVLIDQEGVVRFFQVDGRLPELIKALRRRTG